ncbi:MAG: urea ABC transporter permease subunit UrtB, partial [Candidatus Competibacteraceae bacterium]|nr:urea ABC transporter permease subunit UrtB [Candidatus Competibacteraceae bacterium]
MRASSYGFLHVAPLTLLFFLLCATFTTAIAQDNIQTQIDALAAGNFSAKAEAVDQLLATGHPRTAIVLQAMLESALQQRKSDNRIVISSKSGSNFQLQDAVTGEDLGSASRRDLKRISVNNSLRKHIRTALAKLSLADPDPAVRRAAVDQIIDNFDADSAALLADAASTESDATIRELMSIGAALGALNSEDSATRLAAIDTIQDSLNPEVRNRLTRLLNQEQDATVKAAAARALAGIEQRVQNYALLETTFFGLSLGSVLLLAAIGLAITFGVMGVINMAHGELIMLGAYTTYLIQAALPQFIDWSLLLAVPAAFLVSGLFGIAIERGVIRFLYGRPLETLLATFGVSLILQQLVRTTISAQNVPVANPSWMSGFWQVNSALSLTYNRLFILLFSILVFLALLLILRRTVLGLQVRAVSQNRTMAKAIGIRSERVDMLTFGLGSGIAGVAGVALSQLTNVGPNLGQAYIVDSFMVVV